MMTWIITNHYKSPQVYHDMNHHKSEITTNHHKPWHKPPWTMTETSTKHDMNHYKSPQTMTWTIMMTQKELCIKPYGFLVFMLIVYVQFFTIIIIKCKVSFSSDSSSSHYSMQGFVFISFHPFGGGFIVNINKWYDFKMWALFSFPISEWIQMQVHTEVDCFWLILPPFSGWLQKFM